MKSDLRDEQSSVEGEDQRLLMSINKIDCYFLWFNLTT